ncbi:MAG: helix-turn-helix domain-containing protein [Gammaproteobacteria bacterium]|uniref:helix-turn-helix transcriptional regulator n=1 Tax=Thalassobaculum sp. TaxID=2022740 RepID=UPI0032ED872C
MPITTDTQITDPHVLLDERDLSRSLKVSVRTVQAWRVKGGGPVFLKFNNRLVRYRPSDVDAWLASTAAANTSV